MTIVLPMVVCCPVCGDWPGADKWWKKNTLYIPKVFVPVGLHDIRQCFPHMHSAAAHCCCWIFSATVKKYDGRMANLCCTQ